MTSSRTSQTSGRARSTMRLNFTNADEETIRDGIRILGNGELEKKLTVVANGFTKSAKEKIEAAGGKVEVL